MRLLTLGLTTQQYYDRIRKILLQEYEQQQKEREKDTTFVFRPLSRRSYRERRTPVQKVSGGELQPREPDRERR